MTRPRAPSEAALRRVIRALRAEGLPEIVAEVHPDGVVLRGSEGPATVTRVDAAVIDPAEAALSERRARRDQAHRHQAGAKAAR